MTDTAGQAALPPGDAPPLLEMRGITKRFGGVVALENVSLFVGRGEVVALIGENGAGKSTLMKVLGGVHQPDQGEIRVESAAVRIRSARDAGRLGIAFIHQELTVLDNLDIASNVFLGREPTGGGPLRLLRNGEIEARTEVYLKQVGLTVSPRTSVARLSLAQKQMVEIARALSQQARLIIMDEPTSSLTPGETERLLAVAKDLRENKGVSVVYISHRLGEIQEIADRVVALRDGRNAGDLPRGDLTGAEGNSRMVRLMVGRDLAHAMDTASRDAEADQETGPARIEVRGLRTPRYPDKAVSFSIRSGEVLGFAGLVGAGRTEIAQALFGVEPALAGEILQDGTAARLQSASDAITRGIYLVPEDRRHTGLILDMAIRENVSLPRLSRFATSLGWVRRGAEREAASVTCARLNIKSAASRVHEEGADRLAAILDAPASSLSGGNQQKVVLAKWLALSPKVLIFDEPTRGIDVGAKAEIYALIRELARGGVAVMLISSDMEEVLSISDRIAVLHEGAITGILDRSEFSQEAVMRLAIGDLSGTTPISIL
ncbi:MAG: sugar ABC transporter ATP-binding protein [Cytophagales bacterium]|nr:sugar ABC transporter ATP-binding protein [Armatimonadota bacterium]